MEHPKLIDLYDLMREFFGKRAADPKFNEEAEQVGCVLYESFVFSCGFDEHGGFHASIALSETDWTDRFLGQYVPSRPDLGSIRDGLAQVDAWCRLRLPDKFLSAFDVMEPASW